MPIRTPDMEIPNNVLPPDPEEEWFNQNVWNKALEMDRIPEPHGADKRIQRPDIPFQHQQRLGPLWAPPEPWSEGIDTRDRENMPMKISAEGGADGGQDIHRGGGGPGDQIPLAPWEQPNELPDGQGRGAELEQKASDIPLAPWEQKQESDVPDQPYGLTPEDVAPGTIPKSLKQRAEDVGVGTEGVEAATRFNAALAYGATQGDLEKEKELFRRAIERDYKKRAEVEYHPGLKQLVYRLEGGDGKWNLVKGAGTSSFFQDLAAATPELQTAAAEVAFGMPGTVGGTAIGGPVGGVAGGALLASIAGGTAKMAQLYSARQKGLIDLSDDEIFQLAKEHAMWTAGGTVAVATILKVLGTAWKLMAGKPAELLETFKDQQYMIEGKSLADKLKADAETLAASKGGMRTPTKIEPDGTIIPGEVHEFPVTAGQQSAIGSGKVIGEKVRPGERYIPSEQSDSALGAEAALARRNAGRPVKSVLDKQSAAINDADFAVFGSQSSEPVTEAGRVLRSAINEAKAQKADKFKNERSLLEANKKINEHDLALTGNRSPMVAMEDARTQIENAREALWEPINRAYQGLEKMQTTNVFLEPFRAAARNIERKYGQTILPEVSVTAKGPGGQIIESAKMAGLDSKITNGVERLSSRPASIAEIERLRQDINYSLRQLQKGTAEDSQVKARILTELREGIDESMRQSLPEESFGRILALRHAYSEMEEKFNKGIISTITAKTEDGRAVLAGQDVADFLVKSPDNAKAFTDAIRSSAKFVEGDGVRPSRVVQVVQPEMIDALRATQDGILARMRRQFYDYDTGKWDSKGMAAWIGERREALSEIFRLRGGLNVKTGEKTIEDVGRGNIIDKTFRNQKVLQQTIEQQEARAQKAQELYNKRFGVFTDDPAVLVRKLIDDGRVTDLKAAQKLVRAVGGPEAQAKFRDGLTQAARGELVNGKGMIQVDKIDGFLTSARGKAMTEILGEDWAKNVRTVGDMIKVRELEASGMANQEIAETIGRATPTLQKMARFARVLFPPWSPRGRGLTATLGVLNDKSQRQMGELLADPKKLSELVAMANKQGDPFRKSNRVQLTRLGFAHLGDARDALASFDGNVMDMFNLRPEVDERAGKAAYDGMGKPAEIPEEPIKFQDRPGEPQLPSGMQSVPSDQEGPDERPFERQRRPGEPPRFMNPDHTLRFPQGGPQSFSPEEGVPATRRPMRLEGGGQDVTEGSGGPNNVYNRRGKSSVEADLYRPGNTFAGTQDFLTGESGYTEPGKRMVYDNTGYRESANASLRANEKGWLTYDQAATTEIPKSSHGRPMAIKAGEGPMQLVEGAQEGRPGSALEAGNQGAQTIAKGVYEAVKGGGRHVMDLLERAQSSDPDVQREAAIELGTMIATGGVGRSFAGGAGLGIGGGRLPKGKPSLTVIEGGETVVPKAMDDLSKGMSDSLREAAKAVKDGKDVPGKIAGARANIKKLEDESQKLMKEADSQGYGHLSPQQRIDMLQEINYEIDAGRRSLFSTIIREHGTTKGATPENIAGWLERAGVKDVKIKTSADGKSKYVEFPDPTAAGGKTNVRFSEHPSGMVALKKTNRDMIDTYEGRLPGGGKGGNVKKDMRENVSGDSYAEWGALIDNLKYRLQKAPPDKDGVAQWLISEDRLPRPGSLGRGRPKRAQALEAEPAPTISRDPNQLEMDFGDFGRTPFEGLGK